MTDRKVEFGQRPMYAGSLTGLRTFGVTDDGVLTGVFFNAPWASGENDAVCVYGGMKDALSRIGDLLAKPDAVDEPWTPSHRVAALDCTCGFYAYTDGSNDHSRMLVVAGVPLTFGGAKHRAVGIVEGYGAVTVGSRGFRASKARVVALVLPEGTHARSSVIANHPEAEVYLTVEEALAAHPLTPAMERAS